MQIIAAVQIETYWLTVSSTDKGQPSHQQKVLDISFFRSFLGVYYLHKKLMIRVHAHISSHIHGFTGHFFRGKWRVHQGACSRCQVRKESCETTELCSVFF